jgi:opacity protein-like surface antigen
MKKMILAAAASAAILTSTAFAMEDQFYVKVEGGATMLNKVKDKLTDLKMKSNTAGIFGAGVGYYVMENVRTDLTLNFITNSDLKKSGKAGPYGYTYEDIGQVKHKGKVGSLLLSSYVDLYDAGAFKFYAGAGVGIAQLSEKTQYNFTTPAGLDFPPSYFDTVKIKKVYNFAYQVGVGASAAVADGVKVDLGYSWRDYGTTKSQVAQSGGLNYIYGKTAYRSHNIIAGVRFDI